MAWHEFGVMPEPPRPGQRFDDYKPARYACVRVKDDVIDGLPGPWLTVDCFWRSLDTPGRGLNEAGITLLPPEACAKLLTVAEGEPPLAALLRRAIAEKRYVIHFGI